MSRNSFFSSNKNVSTFFSSNKSVSTFLALVVLFVVGAIGWSYLSNETNRTNLTDPNRGLEVGIGGPGDPNPTPSPAASSIRMDLSKNLVEHGVLATQHLQNLYDGKDTSKSAENIEKNNQAVADIIEQLSGASTREMFLVMWKGHIKEYENYTLALKNNDRNGTGLAKAMLTEQSAQMGEHLNHLVPTISATRGSELMNEHVDLTLSIIEAHAKGEEATKLVQSAKASNQALMFAQELADGIEKISLKSI